MGSRWPLWIHIIVDHHNYWQEAAEEACLHDMYYWRPFAFVNDVAAPPTSLATMEWQRPILSRTANSVARRLGHQPLEYVPKYGARLQ